MAVTVSNVLAFTAGVAAGAVACATYPRWKHKVEPLISAILAGAASATQDAATASERMTAGAGEFHAGHNPVHSPWISARNGAGGVKASGL
jgi:hypothetical protein